MHQSSVWASTLESARAMNPRRTAVQDAAQSAGHACSVKLARAQAGGTFWEQKRSVSRSGGGC